MSKTVGWIPHSAKEMYRADDSVSLFTFFEIAKKFCYIRRKKRDGPPQPLPPENSPSTAVRNHHHNHCPSSTTVLTTVVRTRRKFCIKRVRAEVLRKRRRRSSVENNHICCVKNCEEKATGRNFESLRTPYERKRIFCGNKICNRCYFRSLYTWKRVKTRYK